MGTENGYPGPARRARRRILILLVVILCYPDEPLSLDSNGARNPKVAIHGGPLSAVVICGARFLFYQSVFAACPIFEFRYLSLSENQSLVLPDDS